MTLTEFNLSSVYETPVAWAGPFSTCSKSGAIINFMKEIINELPVDKRLIIPHADGFMNSRNYMCNIKDLVDLDSVSTSEDVVGVLCVRNISDDRLVLMPFDDDSFELGVIQHVAQQSSFVAWEDKKPLAFWRGSPSGGFFPTIRYEVVLRSMNMSFLDARFIRKVDSYILYKMEVLGYTFGINDNQYWTNEETIQTHLQYKYILVIDGTCTASALQWVFASGSVPIVITHPDNNWWFKSYLKPMENYVPVEYDLSDLSSKIEWLIENDDKALGIANGALDLARNVLSSEFQKEYLRKEIERVSAIKTST